MKTRTPLNQQLRHLRRTHQLTQTDLAQHLHVSRQTISSWETGRNQPDLTTLQQLATLYDLSVATLLGQPAVAPTAGLTTVTYALLAVLAVERVTQLSSSSGLVWIDLLLVALGSLQGLLAFLKRRGRTAAQRGRIQRWGLGILGSLSLLSGITGTTVMGFGFATTCWISGVIALAAVGVAALKRTR